nr:MAG TPA: hypothetical protein [Caudoviricetes sp.]
MFTIKTYNNPFLIVSTIFNSYCRTNRSTIITCKITTSNKKII